MDDVGLFIASISHELRNPLNGLSGNMQLISRTELNSSQKQYLHSMNTCCLQLIKIVNNILDFSKLTAGKMTISNECFSISTIKTDINDIIGQKLLEKKQQCNFTLSSNIPDYIVLDKQKLLQIIINLVSNASKFSNINCTIDISITSDSNSNLIITTKDSGIGISKDDMKKLFTRFTQLNLKQTIPGIGLGLIISKKLVEIMGGSGIDVLSELDIGSTFSFSVPYKEVTNYEKEIKKDIRKLKNKTILVVDDNVENRMLLSDILFEWGMNPIICSSGFEALRYILGNRYDFCVGLIDICMPDISGIELAKQIKTERPLFPLIALSSLQSFVDTRNFEHKLDKPINKIQLFNAIFKTVVSEENSIYLNDDESGSNSSLHSISFNKNTSILIAEDFDYNSDMLKNMILEIGYNNISIASDGQVAIDMLKLTNYEIIILDLKMPNIDGYGVIEYITKIKSNIKIIILSASTMEEDRQKCRDYGLKYFISKPIEFKNLKNILLEITEKSI